MAIYSQQNRLAPTVLFSVAILLLQAYTLEAFFRDQLATSYLLLMHLICVFFSILNLGISRWRSWDLKMPLLLIIYTGILSVIGTVIILSATLLMCLFRYHQVNFSNWLASLFPENPETPTEKLYERIIYGAPKEEETHTEPFTDLLSYGTPQQKQLAIVKMTRFFRPQFTKPLKQALKDPLNHVRVQAAAALSELQNNFNSDYHHLKENMEANPNFNAIKNLAFFCKRYADAGLIDTEKRQALYEEAFTCFQKAHQQQPKAMYCLLHAADCLLKLNRADQGLAALEAFYQQATTIYPRFVELYATALIQSAQYEKLRQFIHQHTQTIADNFPQQNDLIVLMKLWSGKEPEYE